jgi:hypothetical protein
VHVGNAEEHQRRPIIGMEPEELEQTLGRDKADELLQAVARR